MAAIFYDPDHYSTAGPRLMGRNAAGESFLRAYFRHGRAETHWAYVDTESHGASFRQAVAAAGRAEPVRIAGRADLRDLKQAGVLYKPDPTLPVEAWRRAMFGDASWSLCGITHATSSARVMDSIAELLTAPLQPWDALICTSEAVKGNVSRVLDAAADHLARRLGTRPAPLLQLPVIPLGIHTDDHAFDAGARAAARRGLGADDDTIVVLYLGRLSAHAKAHPLAMYRALQMASKGLAAGQRVMLVECGWFSSDATARAFARAAALVCPGVTLRHLDGRQAEARDQAWAAADIFCSLADNFQESFGLVPIEAMAAGLPVVVSDWSGYRESVRDGIDGLLIPTLIPPPGTGEVFAIRHAVGIDDYDAYSGYAGAHVAVDIDACAHAFSTLFASADLRRRMGAAGKARARAVYDWQVIIPRYEALWAEQDAIRLAHPVGRNLSPWPARLDPFHAFEGYASRTLDAESRFVLTDADLASAIARLGDYLGLGIVKYTLAVSLPKAGLEAILTAVAAAPRTTGQIAARFPSGAAGLVIRSVVFLLKLGLIRIKA
ncbi:glycosyltransferase family 4 protein [Zavarzinia sp.]|uniref:glycosyltransferase family 4 protein n=1 Tax=Zavarzinia sp. TaxID=2027920 RepID=UPI003BB6516E